MISIIVPVYNVENYLVPCIESILKSTYRDFELILVDDGATDGSGAICDRFATQDERVKVIHKENGGLSDARNAGLKMAIGDYVSFIDGDDRIHSQMIEVLKKAIDSGDFDFSMVYAKKVAEDEASRIYDEPVDFDALCQGQTQLLSADAFFRGLCVLNFHYHVACYKLYKRSLIEGMQFEHLVSEDLEWNNRVSLRMKQAILVKAELYYYIQRKGSIMNNGLNKKTVERIKTYKRCLDAIPRDNHEYRDRMLKLLYSMMLTIRRKCVNSDFQAEAEAACAEVYQDTIQEFKCSNNGRLSKMRSIAGYHFPRLYNFVTRIMEAVVVRYYKLIGRQW